MLIKDLIARGRELYAICPNNHPTEPWPHGQRHIAIDLTKLDPEMHWQDVRKLVRCSVCGLKDSRRIMVKLQTDRQMRQGRER